MKRIYRIFFFVIFAVLFMLSVTTAVSAADSISIVVNGSYLNMDIPPRIINSRIIVPVRAVSEAVGCKTEWFEDQKRVEVYLPENEKPLVIMNINEPITVVNHFNNNNEIVTSEGVTVESPPVIIDGRTFVPLRFIAETIGFTVDWDDSTRTVYINSEVNGRKSSETSAWISGSSVNFRSGPSISAGILNVLQYGQEITYLGENSGWVLARVGDTTGYISNLYVSAEKLVQTEFGAANSGGLVNKPGEGARIIAIDAGHQAKANNNTEPIGPNASTSKAKVASGTSGVVTGVPEYKLTLAVSLKLRDELNARGYSVYMIRESNDVNISNKERAVNAAAAGADILVRIHADGSNNSGVSGILTLSPSAGNPFIPHLYESSRALSKYILNAMVERTGAKNRGIMEVDNMSGINWSSIPVTIVEMGLMTNPDEDRLMQTEGYQQKLAAGIADGIDKFFRP